MPDRYYYLGPWQQTADPDLGTYWHAPAGTIGLVDLRGVVAPDRFGFFASAATLVDPDYTLIGDNGRDMTQLERSAWATLLEIDPIAATNPIDALWETLTTKADPDGDAICPPIMPTHKGTLELHLGGHSLVRSRRFAGTRDPAWTLVQAVTQRNIRAIRARAYRDHRGGGQPTLHLKYLECMRRKLRVPWEELRTAEMGPDERPVRPETEISDDFNRADSGSLGSSSEGWAWVQVHNAFGVASNRAVSLGTSWRSARAASDLSSDDHYAEADGVFGTEHCNVVTRFSSDDPAATQWYSAGVDGGPATAFIYRKESTGSFNRTELWSASEAATSGVIKCEADGSSISFYLDGALQQTVTDTNVTGAVRVGMHGVHDGGQSWDNFLAADLVAGSPIGTIARGII